MQSKTSYFSFALFKKTVGRYMPLWAAYLLVWFLLLPMPLITNLSFQNPGAGDQIIFYICSVAVKGGVVVLSLFSPLAAMAVFGGFCSQRSAAALCSLPVKREGLFLSCYSAAMGTMTACNLIILLPTLLICCLFHRISPAPALLWFLVVTLLGLAFFGIASFAFSTTGNILAIPAVYALLNAGPIAIEALLVLICYAVSYGYSADLFPITDRITPVVDLMMRVNYNYEGVGRMIVGWRALAGWALVGLLLSAAALLLFRRRQMETASDVAAIKVFKPVFRVLAAICGTGCGYIVFIIFWLQGSLSDALRPGYLTAMLALCCFGMAAGWFCGEMMIKKTLKVFSLKGFVKVFCMAAAFCAAVVLVYLDPMGIERRLPEAKDIEWVRVTSYDGWCELHEEENIALVLELNRSVVDNKVTNLQGDYRNYITFLYRTSEGTVRKSYLVSEDSPNNQQTVEILNLPESVYSRNAPSFEVKDGDIITCNIITYRSNESGEALTSHYEADRSEAYDLWKNGILPDLREGNMGFVEDQYVSDGLLSVDIEMEFCDPVSGDTRYIVYPVLPEASNTIAWLQGAGII